MDRTHPQPGWLVLLAALSEVATAAPSRADAGLFEFNSAWLSEQNAEVDPSVLDGARRLRLDGFETGSLRLNLDLQKAAPPPDATRRFHYTVADARKDWLRSLSASQPRRLSLSGAVDHGAARGLSFHVTRNDSARDAALESSLAFSRGGFSADIHMRNVGGHFARSALVGDDEWNRLKDMVGWRQTDMRFQWNAVPGLSLASELSKGRKSDTGESRGHRRLSLDWHPDGSTHLSLYNEVNTTGARSGGARATRRGFALNQTVGNVTLGIAQDEAGGAPGKSYRKRTLSFATPEKARAGFSYTRTDVRKGSGGASAQTIKFHARPTDSLSLAADYATSDGAGNTRKNRGLSLRWTPADTWRFDGQWRRDTAASGPMTDLHLTGEPAHGVRLDARVQRITDPKNRYRRQDTLRLESKPDRGLQWSVQYAALRLKNGAAASVLETAATLQTSLGVLKAAWRDGDVDVLPGYADLTFTTAAKKDSALSLTANVRNREGAPDTQTVDLTWKASDRLTVRAGYGRNPEDKDGRLQDLDGRRIAMAYDVTDRLRLDVARSVESGPAGRTECTDLGLKGRLDDVTTVDVGVSVHAVAARPVTPAYHVNVERTVDDDHRFQLAVERKALPVQKKNDLTASMQLVSTF